MAEIGVSDPWLGQQNVKKSLALGEKVCTTSKRLLHKLEKLLTSTILAPRNNSVCKRLTYAGVYAHELIEKLILIFTTMCVQVPCSSDH